MMTAEQWVKFEKLLTFEKKVEFLLLKLAEPGKRAEPLNQYSEYLGADFVPQEKRAALLRELKSEVRAREQLGDAAYFETQSLTAKIDRYNMALDKMTATAMDNGTLDARVTWAEFKHAIAVQVLEVERILQMGKSKEVPEWLEQKKN